MLLLFSLLILQTMSALSLDINKTSTDEVMVAGVEKPAVFTLEITNYGANDSLQFYNLLGFSMFPVGTVPITTGETKTVDLEVRPIGEFEYMGLYTFEYYIRGQDESEIKQSLTFRRIKIDDAFEIGSGSFNPESNSVDIYVKNKYNFNFGSVNAKFSSPFFNVDKSFTLGPKERKDITIELNKEDFSQLIAGFYTVDAEIKAGNAKIDVSGNLEFTEKNILTEEEKNYGVLVTTKIIKKTNEGNVLEFSEVKIKKNIISRLFTSFSPDPTIVERQGASVYYTWTKEISPGESFEVSIKTNYLFPLILIIIIVSVVVLAKQYSKTNLLLNKKVSFVKTKGGEFALKVTIHVHPKTHMENITIIDRLPPLVKLYEKFGLEKPIRVDEKLKRIEWGFSELNTGEVRVISYILYSKVGVLGKFALPSATGVYEKDGKVHETISNRAFFVSEQRTTFDEE